MDSPKAIGGVDPSQARTLVEFANLLQEVKDRADVSISKIKRRTSVNGVDIIGGDTIHAMLHAKRIPSKVHLCAFLRGCNVPMGDIRAWEEKRLELKRLEDEGLGAGLAALQKQTTELTSRLTGAETRIVDLQQRETQLRSELAAEEERASKAESDRDLANHRIAELETELQDVRSELRRLQADYGKLCNTYNELKSIEEALRAEYNRAEAERQMREAAERGKRTLEQRVTDLERQLDGQRTPVSREPDPQPAQATPEFINRDLHVEKPFELDDTDFDDLHTLVLTYAWYCEACKKGGERSYDHCPHCGREASHDYHKPVTFRLKGVPRYGERTLPKCGNSDNPELPASDVYIQVARKPSFKERWRNA